MSRLTMKRGDTRPILIVALTDAEDTPVDVTGATLRFLMREQAAPATVVLNTTATTPNAASGILHYVWVAGDTATIGRFYGEFEVTFADGTVLTAPTDDYLRIIVKDDLG